MADPRLEVLTPQNSQAVFIDHQPQLVIGVRLIDPRVLKCRIPVRLALLSKDCFG